MSLRTEEAAPGVPRRCHGQPDSSERPPHRVVQRAHDGLTKGSTRLDQRSPWMARRRTRAIFATERGQTFAEVVGQEGAQLFPAADDDRRRHLPLARRDRDGTSLDVIEMDAPAARDRRLRIRERVVLQPVEGRSPGSWSRSR